MIGDRRLEHPRANAEGTPSSSNTGHGENVSAHKPKTVRIKPAEGSTPQFAMVHRVLIESGISDGAFRAWCFMDGRAGDQGYDVFGYHYIAERIGHQSETIGGYMRELEGLGLVHIPPANRGAKKHVKILWQPSRGISPTTGEIPELPPAPTRHHSTGTHGSAAKSLEMKRYAKVEPSRRTGDFSANLPDEQETNLPDERDSTFPTNGNPLSSEASYEGVVVGNSGYEGVFSSLPDDEAADVEFYVAADFETGELLEAPRRWTPRSQRRRT